MKRIDLSHPIVPGMKTYPGLPVPEAHVLLDYEASRPCYPRDGPRRDFLCFEPRARTITRAWS